MGDFHYTPKLNILMLEQYADDGFFVRRNLIRVCGDLVAGILLSQIMYWFKNKDDGKSKLRVMKEGRLWLARNRNDWKDELFITPKQYDRAIKILTDKKFVEVKLFKFNAVPTPHIYLDVEKVTADVISFLTKGESPFYPNGKVDIDERGKSLTKTTNIDYNKDVLETPDDQENEKPKPKNQNPLLADDSEINLPKEMLFANKMINRMVEQNIYGNTNTVEFGHFIETHLKQGVSEQLIEHLIFEQVKGKSSRVRYYEAILDDWIAKGIKEPSQLKSPKPVRERRERPKQTSGRTHNDLFS